MLQTELETRKRQLEMEVAELQEKFEPLRQRLEEKREELALVSKLLSYEAGEPAEAESRFRGIHSWADICREKGWTIGADSAHRVVMRQDPTLHASIQHQCTYGGRTY